MMTKRFLLLFLSLSVAGCATLDREECLSADWQLIGYNDGVAGRTSERLEQHREACAEYGITPVMDHYLEGHFQGAEDYCTAENGYTSARSGQSFNPICRGQLRFDYEHGHRLGQEAYQQLEQLKQAEQDLRELKSELRSADNRISDYETELVADATKKEQRQNLLRKIESERHDSRHLKSRIRLQSTEVEMERRYLKQLEDELRQQL